MENENLNQALILVRTANAWIQNEKRISKNNKANIKMLLDQTIVELKQLKELKEVEK